MGVLSLVLHFEENAGWLMDTYEDYKYALQLGSIHSFVSVHQPHTFLPEVQRIERTPTNKEASLGI